MVPGGLDLAEQSEAGVFADTVIFTSPETAAETAVAVQTVCRLRSRARIYVPNDNRDSAVERRLLAAVSKFGVHVSLDAIDRKTAVDLLSDQPGQRWDAGIVVRPSTAGISLGVLERALLRSGLGPIWFWNTPKPLTARVVVACAADEDDTRRQALNAATVDTAAALAGRLGGRVVLANVSDRRDAEPSLRRLAERADAGRIGIELEIRSGAVTRTLSELVGEQPPSILVAGSMSRRGLAALDRPNTVDRLIDGAEYSVVVVPETPSRTTVRPAALGQLAAALAVVLAE